jgi:hypothetical protein
MNARLCHSPAAFPPIPPALARSFVTIESDLRAPRRALAALSDAARTAATLSAVRAAVRDAARGGTRDVRVLLLGR